MKYLYTLTTICLLGMSITVALPIEDDVEEVVAVSNELGEGAEQFSGIIDLDKFGENLFGEPDDQLTGQAVTAYNPESGVNPEELGSYAEGDILVLPQKTRNGLVTKSAHWPNGIVPFEIRGNFNAREMATIESAIIEYHTKTCIRFKPRTTERDYISIESGSSGCWSAVGRVGGKQEVNLQSPGCLTKRGTPMHELMHALGFMHEQNRHERDNYVAIRFENIDTNAASNFEKASASTTGFGVTYDYGSVMHYSSRAFSRNGQATIIPLQNGAEASMGQRDGFSYKDIQKLNAMYNCRVEHIETLPQSQGANQNAGASNNGGAGQAGRPGSQGQSNIFLNFLNGVANGLGLTDEEHSDGEPTLV